MDITNLGGYLKNCFAHFLTSSPRPLGSLKSFFIAGILLGPGHAHYMWHVPAQMRGRTPWPAKGLVASTGRALAPARADLTTFILHCTQIIACLCHTRQQRQLSAFEQDLKKLRLWRHKRQGRHCQVMHSLSPPHFQFQPESTISMFLTCCLLRTQV